MTIINIKEQGIRRGFTTDNGVAFSAHAPEPASVRVEVKGFQPAGNAALRINGQPAVFTVEGDALCFTIPAGAAEVQLMGKASLA